MTTPESPYEARPPTARRLLIGVAGTVAGAVLILVLFVLPAERGIDPTGLGGLLGLTGLSSSARTLEIRDVFEGGERITELEIPDFGEPVPLPNPAVHQEQAAGARSDTLIVSLGPGQRTEVKAMMPSGKVLLYSWQTDRGPVYSDFHGHDPALGDDFWVRYREHESAASAQGSLVAPIDGEHGWYWVNFNDFPVEITLQLRGFHDDIIDYGTL